MLKKYVQLCVLFLLIMVNLSKNLTSNGGLFETQSLKIISNCEIFHKLLFFKYLVMQTELGIYCEKCVERYF